jgi:hypothetical protein
MKSRDAPSSACSACAAGFSVVCMSSMGAAIAAATAAVGASATGMAGMGAAQASPSGSLWLTRLFETMGLGILNRLPNEVAQPLLAALLVISIGAAYVASRGHRSSGALVLTLGSAMVMYTSIYIWMSELVYFLSLAGIVVAAIWGFFLARGTRAISAM